MKKKEYVVPNSKTYRVSIQSQLLAGSVKGEIDPWQKAKGTNYDWDDDEENN